jgi:hypothetical protein
VNEVLPIPLPFGTSRVSSSAAMKAYDYKAFVAL